MRINYRPMNTYKDSTIRIRPGYGLNTKCPTLQANTNLLHSAHVLFFQALFLKLRKAAISFVMSVRLSVYLPVCLFVYLSLRMEQLGSQSTDFFIKFIVWLFFANLSRKFKFQLKPNKNNGHFTWRPMYVYGISLNSSQNEKYFRQICKENQNTHFVFSNFFFRKSCCLWNNVGKILYSRTSHRWQYGECASHAGYLRLQHTLRTSNIYCLSTTIMVTWTRLNVTFIRTWRVLFISALVAT